MPVREGVHAETSAAGVNSTMRLFREAISSCSIVLRALEGELGLETLAIPRDRRDRQPAIAARVGDRTVARFECAVDLHRVPLLGVADIVDRDVVMLAPEKRNGVEPFAMPSMLRAATWP